MTATLVQWLNPNGIGFIFDPAITYYFGTAGSAVAAVFVFCLGACLGSFANACAMRLVRDEDFVATASRCRGCDTRLAWHENLPVIGFLKQRGRCRRCGMKLSPRYIIVEILGGLALFSYAAPLPLGIAAGFGVALVLTGIACLTDLESLTLHPAILSLLGVTGICCAVAADAGLFTWHLTSAQALAGTLVSALLPMAINAAYRLFRGRNGFGEGDYWLLAAFGAWLGPVMGPALFIAASWLGAMVGVGMMLAGRASAMTKLPFGLFAGSAFILWPNLFTRVF